MNKLYLKLRSNELASGSLINFSVKVLSFLLTYVTMFILINKIGISYYGKYNLYLTFISVVGSFIIFGTNTFFLKEISVFKEVDKKSYIFNKISTIICINFIILLALMPIIKNINNSSLYFEKNGLNLIVILFLSLLSAFIANFVSGLRGSNKILIYSISERFLLLFFTTIILLFGIYFSLKLETVLIFSYMITFIIILLLFRKYVLNRKKNNNPEGHPEKDVRYSILGIYKHCSYIFISTLLLLVISKTDTFFLSIYTDLSQVGYYNVLLQLSFFINFAMSSINGILSPMISRKFESKQYKNLAETLRQANIIIFITSFFAGLLLLIFIKPIFLFMNLTINDSLFTALLILIMGQIISALMGSVINLLNMSGYFKEVTVSVVFSLIISIISCIILIPRFGMIGASISTALGIITKDVISTLFGFKKFNFKFSLIDFRKNVIK